MFDLREQESGALSGSWNDALVKEGSGRSLLPAS